MTKLTDITHNKDILTRLLQLYTNDPNRETLGYATLKNYLDWFKQMPNLMHTTIYTYGNWKESGLYLIVDRYQLIFGSLKPNDSDLGAAMKLLDWSRGFSVFPVAEQQHDVVVKTLQELQMPHSGIKLLVYKLPRKEALNWHMTCPADYEVSTLTTADAEYVNSVWPPRLDVSIHYIRRMIDMNVSVALRKRDNGKLVAWCTRCFTGLLSTLQVIDECQRQGLAALVICQFAQKIAAMGEDVWCAVRETNKASNTLFQKLKFQHCGAIYFFPVFDMPGDKLWTID